MTIAYYVLLGVSAAGLLCCTGFVLLIVVAAIRFRLRRPPATPAGSAWPPVSLLKPLCGLEPNLASNLASFFQQNYGNFEIVFGMRDTEDAALAIARTVQAGFPGVPVRYVFSGQPDRPNAKVCSLEKMIAAASFDYLVISDSDVRVTPEYITEVVRPLLTPENGLVNCIYRGVPSGGIWSRLEALGMSVEMTAGVIVAELLEGMKFALGPTMAIRREVLDSVGGVSILADYCADDYVLGERVAAAGKTVVLSSHIIDHFALHRRFRDSVDHQVRWMKSTRFSRPMGHVGTGVTFAMPFGLLGLAAGLIGHHPNVGIALLAYAVVNRFVMAWAAGWGAVRDPRALWFCWLYPVRDLMGFAFWVASYWSTTIVWRREKYRLQPGGFMVKADEGKPSSARPVTVDRLP